jgi:hypothetical protein
MAALNSYPARSSLRWIIHILRNSQRVWARVTDNIEQIGNCTVLCYEERGGLKIRKIALREWSHISPYFCSFDTENLSLIILIIWETFHTKKTKIRANIRNKIVWIVPKIPSCNLTLDLKTFFEVMSRYFWNYSDDFLLSNLKNESSKKAVSFQNYFYFNAVKCCKS